MQFGPEQSNEERRRRQRDYHAFLDAQVEARHNAQTHETTAADHHGPEVSSRLPTIAASGRLNYQAIPPPQGVSVATGGVGKSNRSLGVAQQRSIDDYNRRETQGGVAGANSRDELLNRLEQRLEGEVQRRYLVEQKLAVLGQKVMVIAEEGIVRYIV